MDEQAVARPGNVVVGVDGSESSRQALRWAADYAELVGADVDAIAAWHYPTNSIGGIPSNWHPGDDARGELASSVRAVFGASVPANLRQLVREGTPAKVLLNETRDAQMLVVGSRGLGGFAGMLLGSVSANCAEHATCPVLVIHAKTPTRPAAG